MNDFCVVTEGTWLCRKMEECISHFQAFNLRREHKVHDSLKPHEVYHNILSFCENKGDTHILLPKALSLGRSQWGCH